MPQHGHVRHPDNPFFRIRQELHLPLQAMPVAANTVSHLERGNRRLVTARILNEYCRLSRLYHDTTTLLHDYQRIYGYPLTPVQAYAGQKLSAVGYCQHCDQDNVRLVRNSRYFQHICRPCYNRKYAQLPHARETALRAQLRSSLGDCEICGDYRGSVRCFHCGKILCRFHRRAIGAHDEQGNALYWCHDCFIE